jgi:YVTN family beta-propeller protein
MFLALASGTAASAQAPRERVYVGEQACRPCHHQPGGRDQFSAWRLTKHAEAYAALSMAEALEIADLSGIEGDPTTNRICLGCHTTAYDTEEWERDETFHFADGIQCERCHGPGSAYIDDAVMRDPERARAAGLRMPEESTCLICHKEKGSHTAVLGPRPFDYAAALRAIAHPGRGGPSEAAAVGPPASDTLPGPKFVGAVACGTCHDARSGSRAFSTWRASPHADAYATLGTGRAEEIARGMGVRGDPQASDQCLACHATGAGEPAGRRLSTFDPAQGVQCESCHGPGSAYMPEAVMLDPVAAAEAGLADVDRTVCAECHTGIHGRTLDVDAAWQTIDHSAWEAASRITYKTPLNLAITQDGRRLFVACEASNSVVVVDTHEGTVITEIPVGIQPHFVLLLGGDTRAYVSNRGSDNVSVIDVVSLRVTATIAVGDEPHEMAANAAGTLLYVANAATYDVSVIDLETGREVKRLAASRGPWGAARSPSGEHIYVTNNLPRLGTFRAPLTSEVTVIDATRATVVPRPPGSLRWSR